MGHLFSQGLRIKVAWFRKFQYRYLRMSTVVRRPKKRTRVTFRQICWIYQVSHNQNDKYIAERVWSMLGGRIHTRDFAKMDLHLVAKTKFSNCGGSKVILWYRWDMPDLIQPRGSEWIIRMDGFGNWKETLSFIELDTKNEQKPWEFYG